MEQFSPDSEPRIERIRAIRDAFDSLIWLAHRQQSSRLQDCGLTKPQFITLAVLATPGFAFTMRELTEVTLQDAPTMTGIVNRLIKVGLVERTRSTVDRRVVLVKSTPAGQALYNEIEAQDLKDDLMGYAALNDEDLTVLEQLLGYILRMYMRRYMDSHDVDYQKALERLKLFKQDPVTFAKIHTNGKHAPEKVAVGA